MSNDSLYVVIGAGPGIGRATAAHFAKNGFGQISLLSRNAERLKEDEAAIREAAGTDVKITSHAVDITDLNALRQTLAKVEKEGKLECVHFNAARVEPSPILETPVEVIEKDFRVSPL